MLEPTRFVEKLYTGGVTLATGVPDSLLANFCQYLDNEKSPLCHVTNTSEGAAIALAAGYHLATNQLGLVYLQNSGLGNAVNPLTSLTSPQVCGIPMVLLIGWRAEINETGEQVSDEPQHIHQGAITLPLLNLLKIPFWVLSSQEDEASYQISTALKTSRSLESPVALVARKNLFTAADTARPVMNRFYPSRETFIENIFALTPSNWPVVATTGKAAREAYEISKQQENNDRAFLCVGAMGHAIQIAAGIALGSKQRVICIDGDGAALMHLGSLVVASKADRLIHIMINNGVHESVGSQPIADQNIVFTQIAKDLGYNSAYRVTTLTEFEEALQQSLSRTGSVFIEALSMPGSRENLTRPSETPKVNKRRFMSFASGIQDR